MTGVRVRFNCYLYASGKGFELRDSRVVEDKIIYVMRHVDIPSQDGVKIVELDTRVVIGIANIEDLTMDINSRGHLILNPSEKGFYTVEYAPNKPVLVRINKKELKRRKKHILKNGDKIYLVSERPSVIIEIFYE